jgi:hypothetical protein
MVDAIARGVLAKDERRTSGEHLIQTGADWIQVEADRSAWVDTGREVVKVAVEINEGRGWQEVGHFGAMGGVLTKRDGITPSTISSARFERKIPAGTFARVVVDSKQILDTAVRLTWG